MEDRSILIYGAGATGIFLGVKLKEAGFNVLLLGRDKLFSLGEKVLIRGKEYDLPPKAREVRDRKFDMVFVMVKLYSLKDVLREMKERNVTSDTVVLSQNGMFDEDMLQDIEKEKVADMIIFEGYRVDEEKGELIAQENVRGWQIGESPQSGKVKDVLERAGISALVNPRARPEKMIINCGINVLSVVEGRRVGELLEDERARRSLISLMEETYKVVSKRYEMRSFEEIKKEALDSMQKMASHYPSLYQDFHAGERTEAAYLNGKVIQWAKEEGIEVPENERVYKAFLDMADRV